MQNEPRTGARKPEQTDGPLGGVQIGNAVADLAPHVAPYYDTTADRDSAHVDYVTEGHTLTDGMPARVNNIGLMQYVNGTWLTVANLEDIAALQFPRLLDETHGTVQYNHSGTTEVQVTGGSEIDTITGLTLTSGRLYIAEFFGKSWAGVAGVTSTLNIRVGASLSTSSVCVASRSTVQPAVGPNGINNTPFYGKFVVQTTGTYSVGLFGVVASGSFAVGADARGRYEVLVSDDGPAISGMQTVTS